MSLGLTRHRDAHALVLRLLLILPTSLPGLLNVQCRLLVPAFDGAITS